LAVRGLAPADLAVSWPLDPGPAVLGSSRLGDGTRELEGLTPAGGPHHTEQTIDRDRFQPASPGQTCP